jgi:hypothetical protein
MLYQYRFIRLLRTNNCYIKIVLVVMSHEAIPNVDHVIMLRFKFIFTFEHLIFVEGDSSDSCTGIALSIADYRGSEQ